MENIFKIYKNFLHLLDEKATITLGEVRNIKRAVSYILKKEKNEIVETQFVKDAELIQKALEALEIKIESYQADIEYIFKDIQLCIGKQKEAFTKENLHLELILKLDCMQNRSFQISDKLKYLYRAYENLISPYNTLYLPLPSIAKRIKTSNLMLFFNDGLNSAVERMGDFFEIKNQKIEEKIFSTWDFSSYEHIKDIDDTNKTYISLSFWFYEKQIFYPIAYHEIAHSIYMNESYSDKLKNIKLSPDEKKEITQELLIQEENIFSKSMIYTLYQDIVADFSAYALAGSSYIFTLFFTGFMQNIHKNFYKDYQTESEIKQEKISDDERKCSTQHKKLTMLDWAHIQSKDNNFIAFYVRVKILLYLHYQVSTSRIFNNEIKGISQILNLIYPDIDADNSINSFENIFSSFQPQSSHYQYNKSYTLLLLSLLKNKVFNDKKLHKRVELVRKKTKIKFLQNKNFMNIIKRSYPEYDQIINSAFISEYDFFWKRRFDYFEQMKNQNNKQKTENTTPNNLALGRLLRLYNLTKLGIIEDMNESEIDKCIYELTFIKYDGQTNRFLNFKGNTRLADKYLENPIISYAYGPYDEVILSQNTTNEMDKFLHKKNIFFTKKMKFSKEKKPLESLFKFIIKKEIFFTDRHTLFLLNEFSGTKVDNNFYNLCISIDMKNELSPQKASCDYQGLKALIENFDKTKYRSINLFASMGNENYIVYISGISLDTIDAFTTELYKKEAIKNISTTVLLNQDIADESALNHDSLDRELIALCKIKKSDKSHQDMLVEITKQIEDFNSKNNLCIKAYKKYGVFDLLIVFNEKIIFALLKEFIKSIQPFVNDTQFELQTAL